MREKKRCLFRVLIVSKLVARADVKLTVDISQIRRIFLDAQNSVFLAMFDNFDDLDTELNINGIDMESDEEDFE